MADPEQNNEGRKAVGLLCTQAQVPVTQSEDSAESQIFKSRWSGIGDIVRMAIGEQVTHVSPIDNEGMSNKVFVASTSSGRVVVRTNVVSHLTKYEKEAWCLKQAQEIGILVPPVVALGATTECSYSISRFIEGSVPVDERFDRLEVWKRLGNYAAKLNSIPIEGCGTEMIAEGRFEKSWQDELAAELAIIFRDSYWTESGLLTPSQLRVVQKELESCALIRERSGLCHWDIGIGNARIRNSNYDEIYLLDLEFVVAAPVPHYQSACVAKPQGLFSSEMKAFVEGYGLSRQKLAELDTDLRRLVVLKWMRSVRWAQDRRPQYVIGIAEESKSIIHKPFRNQLEAQP